MPNKRNNLKEIEDAVYNGHRRAIEDEKRRERDEERRAEKIAYFREHGLTPFQRFIATVIVILIIFISGYWIKGVITDAMTSKSIETVFSDSRMIKKERNEVVTFYELKSTDDPDEEPEGEFVFNKDGSLDVYNEEYINNKFTIKKIGRGNWEYVKSSKKLTLNYSNKKFIIVGDWKDNSDGNVKNFELKDNNGTYYSFEYQIE